MRTKWKGYFVAPVLLEQFRKKEMGDSIKVFSRGSTILPEFKGHTFLVYNGKKFESIQVTSEMFFRKFGEYSMTKKIGYSIHLKKKRSKKKRKR